MIAIDGSAGEGGGQVLRTSLALSVLTGQPFRIDDIRGRRRRPGLLRQHLTGVRAAAAISGAEVTGDELKSGALTFRPGVVAPGEYRFAVGTAGSANLVLQTVLPPLMLADGPSLLTLEGGTHNDKSPPFHYLRDVFLPVLARMGPTVDLQLARWGFYPAGGGEMVAEITPAPLQAVALEDRGRLLDIAAMAVVSALPGGIAKRELAALERALDRVFRGQIVEVDDPAGPGNVLLVFVRHEAVTEVFVGFGAKGLSAERLAEQVAREVDGYLRSGVAVGEHLADQLLLPMALAGGGAFTTVQPSLHTRTNIDVIRRFLDVEIQITEVDKRSWRVEVAT